MADIFTVNQGKYLAYQIIKMTGNKSEEKAQEIVSMIEDFVEKEFMYDPAFEQLADKLVNGFEEKGLKFPYDL